MNNFARVRCDDSCTQDGTFLVGNNFGESITEIAGIGARDDGERRQGFIDLQVALDTIVFG